MRLILESREERLEQSKIGNRLDRRLGAAVDKDQRRLSESPLVIPRPNVIEWSTLSPL